MADFDPLHVGASVQTYPGLAISNIRLKRALFNSLLADPDRLRRVLTDAGFNDIEITPEIRTLKLALGDSLDNWVQERLLMGLAGEIYTNSSFEIQSQARQLLISSVEPYQVEDGLEMNGASWIVTARA